MQYNQHILKPSYDENDIRNESMYLLLGSEAEDYVYSFWKVRNNHQVDAT